MKCPKCEEGTIKKVAFKKSERLGYLCDFCGTAWMGDENVGVNTGHPFDAVSQGDVLEYTLEESEEEDQEHRDVMYHENK
ncbi:MAG: hypothetical protein Q7T54_00630 [Candidatus Levybacteria bacterium]|nr:hypothetical protein [Candidatus Levybacteria bacterium]